MGRQSNNKFPLYSSSTLNQHFQFRPLKFPHRTPKFPLFFSICGHGFTRLKEVVRPVQYTSNDEVVNIARQ